MSDEKKGKLVVIGIGLIMMVIAVLVFLYAAKTEHYTATITEITNTKTTSSSKGKTKYHEYVSVTFTDGSGSERTGSNIHLKSSVKSTLPEVGDTIEVKGKNKVSEYNLTSYMATVFVMGIVGLILVIRGLVYKPKPKKQSKGTGEQSEA